MNGLSRKYSNANTILGSLLKKGFMKKISTLIEVKVLPCTMSKGFHMWWRISVSEVLNS